MAVLVPWDIAIIGTACRFPGAASIADFWNNLAAGIESITTFSESELLAAGVPPLTLAQPHYVRAAPIIDDHDGFDAAFFGYSPREARCRTKRTGWTIRDRSPPGGARANWESPFACK